MMRTFTIVFLILITGFSNNAFTQNRGTEPDPQRERLLLFADSLREKYDKQRAELERIAQQQGWVIRTEGDFGESQIMFIDEFGSPQAYTTFNLNAARTVGTNQLWNGGTAGLNLTGNNYTIGIWDGGGVRTTHNEFGSRVTIQDSAPLRDHATHVGGTMAASGVSSNARGMASQVTLRSYEWTNDYSEMATEAANGLTLSNHSYGQIRGWAMGNWANGGADSWHWWGTTSISTVEDYRFGFYDDLAKDLDQVAANAPNYLIVFAAGNDRDDAGSGTHWVRNSQGNWVSSNASRNPDGNANGYDCLPQQQVAKNILTVGAVNDIVGGWTQPSDVVITSFSSYGPTDDGRIKPDIVANGASLFSTGSVANNDYYTSSGTSMASPNVTGSLALLQEHYRNLRGNNGAIVTATLSAAALKALVINTANEAGTSDGPDYRFGWGLLNSIGAAQKITDDDNQGGLIVQGILNGSQTTDYTYYSDGSEINVTLCWTDPPGTPPAAALNPTTLMLVNNLNLRVIRQDPSTTYFPWVLNPASPAAAATKANNTRDNVETVNVKNPTPGYYTIRISHSGTLSGGQQAYALVVTGLSVPPAETYCKARASSNTFEFISRVQFGAINNYSTRAPGGYHDYRGQVIALNKGASQSITVTMPGGAANSLGRVYIDWNQDGDFSDAGETIVLGSGVGPSYSTTITVPASALGGYTTMRVRVGFNSAPACGNVTYGETEDYTIFVVGTPGLWTGTKSNDWFDPKNWHDGKVPTSTVNVTIPSGTPFQPVIGGGNTAYCNNLVIQSGGLLTQNSTSYFYVYGNFDSDAGQFIMNGTTSFLYFAGSVNTWWDDDNENDTYTNVRVLKNSPAVQLTMWQNMTCSGTFEVREGIFAIDASWTLTVTNTGVSAFRIEDGGTINLAGSKSIHVSGGIHFLNGSNAVVAGGTIRCGGRFRVDSNTSNDIALTGSTLILNGSGSQTIEDLDGGNLQLHNLTINKPSGTATISNAYLNVSGNLLIQSGALNLGAFGCSVLGATDVYGTLAMTNGTVGLSTGSLTWRNGSVANITTGTIYTNMWDFQEGCNAQITTGNTAFIKNMFYPTEPSAHFGHLVIQAPSAIMGDGEGRANYPVNVAGNLTVQSGVSWFFPAPSGMIVNGNSNIQSGGTLNFFSSGVFNTAGSLTIAGTLNLSSSATALVNNGFSLPSSGTLNINGGSFISDNAYIGGWTFIHGALNMASGLFELTNNALNFSASATTNISGGIIRSGITIAADLGNNFKPTGGTVEITGLMSGNLFIGPSNWFHNLRYVSVANNNLILQNNTTIKSNLIIDGGTVFCTAGSSQLTVGGDFINNSPALGFSHGNGTVIFNGSGAANHQHVTGTVNFFNVTNAKTGGGELRFTGTANIANNFIANGINVVSGSALTVGNQLDLSAGQMSLTAAGPIVSVNNLLMGGTLALAGGSFSCTDIVNNGIFGSIYMTDGTITFNQDPAQWTDLRGTFNILGGTMTVNGGSGESWWGFAGTPTHVSLSGGVMDFANPGILINGGALFTSSITGGTIKTSGNFFCDHANFTASGNLVEMYGNTNAVIRTLNGSYFHNLRINKSGGAMLGIIEGDEKSALDDAMHRYIRQLEIISLDPEQREKLEFPSGRAGNSVNTTGVLNVNNNLIIAAGTLTASHTLSNSGDVTVNSGGNLVLMGNGSLLMGASRAITINNGGAIELIGDISLQPKISRISTGNYAFNLESGSSIGAVYALFEYMNTSGVNIKPGAMVDPAKAFHYSTFRNGQSGGRLLTINNSQSFAVNYANFPNNTWGGNYNVFKTENAGVVVFGGHGGIFSGEANEWDPFSRIHWGGEISPFVNLQGVDIAGGQDMCFEATNTLTIGGGGSVFHVQNGANANLVAGQKIVMFDGTRVFSGGYMLARITTTSDYCSLPPALLAFLAEEENQNLPVETSLILDDDLISRVYPNPTTGTLTLELSQVSYNTTLEIFGALGERILMRRIDGMLVSQIDLSDQPSGIYFLRVVNNKVNRVIKVVKQ